MHREISFTPSTLRSVHYGWLGDNLGPRQGKWSDTAYSIDGAWVKTTFTFFDESDYFRFCMEFL